ncbi:MAG: hypothetical protein ABL927_14385, partial [Bdellovibrionales bacterium]
GVDMTTASLGFTVINMRGFNSTSPVRSLQIIDGVDNQAPGLNFSLGNFLGCSELDANKVDLVVGASSAFYGPNAFNEVPMFWKKAVEKYTEDTLKAYGINPWHVDKMMFKLTEAFKKENIDLILHYSADLGHYIADGHVPLHTTENYNGQLTGQRGIHGFWESRIPELKSESYDFFIGKAFYIEKPIVMAWQTIKESNAAVDSVLGFERDLNAKFPVDKKYGYETRGAMTIKTYSQEYTNTYDEMIKGQVERRMRKAILMVGSAWYTCWVNAGKPNLDKMGDKEVSDSLLLVQKKEEELYQQHKEKSVKGHDD